MRVLHLDSSHRPRMQALAFCGLVTLFIQSQNDLIIALNSTHY
jgi:hypothetical protein